MINEHKAHASFVLKVINVVIGCGFVLVLAVIIYDMFFHISNDLIIAYELIIVPSFSLLTYVLFGIAYKEITKLTNYDKHKLICEFVRDTTISAISNELTIIGTMTLYQLQNPTNPLVFIVSLAILMVYGSFLIGVLIKKYFEIIKTLKSIKKIKL